MEKRFSFFFLFIILAVISAGCSNKEEITAKPPVNNEKIDLSSKENVPESEEELKQEEVEEEIKQQEPEQQEQQSFEQQEETTVSIASVGEKQPYSEKEQVKKTKETQEIPSYTVNIRSGIIAQQRLVEVKIDTDNPNQYIVQVMDEQLEYRKEVDLFVGLINSMDDEEITNSVTVSRR